MKRINEGNFELKHCEIPKEINPIYEGNIDLFKFNKGCVNRDIKSHHHLRHVRTNDKTSPKIPQHTKPLMDFSHQNLMKSIEERKRAE
ncbi:hypothetical protein ENUP19_0257G0104 [Entamoeba nuttalli]|uniref:Uncharacterized protein n=1 Tax=Entamoeba nuttalli TaxID=412467 RepID=A0ABQ0DS36_9EUKA